MRARVWMCVRVCVCHNDKKVSNEWQAQRVCVAQRKNVPDEWQARQAISAILQVSSSKHNAKKNTTRVRGPFHQAITAILAEEKKRSSLLNLHITEVGCATLSVKVLETQGRVERIYNFRAGNWSTKFHLRRIFRQEDPAKVKLWVAVDPFPTLKLWIYIYVDCCHAESTCFGT